MATSVASAAATSARRSRASDLLTFPWRNRATTPGRTVDCAMLRIPFVSSYSLILGDESLITETFYSTESILFFSPRHLRAVINSLTLRGQQLCRADELNARSRARHPFTRTRTGLV